MMMSIFTNGVFDIIHPGHMQLLMHCRYLAETEPVYVAIDSDRKVREEKGPSRPYYSQEERKETLLSLTVDVAPAKSRAVGNFLIDWVYIFDNDKELHDLVKKINPFCIIKGEDYKQKYVIGCDITNVEYFPRNLAYSTSDIERRILSKWE